MRTTDYRIVKVEERGELYFKVQKPCLFRLFWCDEALYYGDYRCRKIRQFKSIEEARRFIRSKDDNTDQTVVEYIYKNERIK